MRRPKTIFAGGSGFAKAALVLGGSIGFGFLVKSLLDSDDEEIESFEKVYVDPKAKRSSNMPLQKLIPPLALPLRRPTPHGYYGARRPTDTSKPQDHLHQGVDLGGKSGEKIFAVGDGEIVKSNPGKGEIVRVLLLADGRAVVYADLGEALVEAGKKVKAGDVIGTVRKNGFVHIAIRNSRYGSFMDPAGIIPFESPKPTPPKAFPNV